MAASDGAIRIRLAHEIFVHELFSLDNFNSDSAARIGQVSLRNTGHLDFISGLSEDLIRSTESVDFILSATPIETLILCPPTITTVNNIVRLFLRFILVFNLQIPF